MFKISIKSTNHHPDNQLISNPHPVTPTPWGCSTEHPPTINHNVPTNPWMSGGRRFCVRCSEAEACGVKKQHMMGVPTGTPSEATHAEISPKHRVGEGTSYPATHIQHPRFCHFATKRPENKFKMTKQECRRIFTHSNIKQPKS